MSIRASLDEAVRAIRVVAELETEVVQAADWLRSALPGGHKVLTHVFCELIEPYYLRETR